MCLVVWSLTGRSGLADEDPNGSGRNDDSSLATPSHQTFHPPDAPRAIEELVLGEHELARALFLRCGRRGAALLGFGGVVVGWLCVGWGKGVCVFMILSLHKHTVGPPKTLSIHTSVTYVYFILPSWRSGSTSPRRSSWWACARAGPCRRRFLSVMVVLVCDRPSHSITQS